MKEFINQLERITKKNIVKELIALMIFAILVAGLVFTILCATMHKLHWFRQIHYDYYTGSMTTIDRIEGYVSLIEKADKNDRKKIVDKVEKYVECKAYVVTSDGKVCSDNSDMEYVDLEEWKIKSLINNKDKISYVIYPFELSDKLYYVLAEADISDYYIYSNEGMIFVSGIAALGVFFYIVFRVVRKKVVYIHKIGDAVEEIKKGNLNTQISIEGTDELAAIAESIQEMETNLTRLIDEEKENARKKNELITGMAHDIKTPVTIITGYLDILRTKKYSSEADRELYTEKACERSESLRLMIQKLFETARCESSIMKDERCNVRLDTLVRQAAMEYEQIALDKGLAYSVDIQDVKEMYLNVDGMVSVIENILGNAIKYCLPGGSINVDMHDDNDYVMLTVSNSSMVIKDYMLDKIFDEFYRIDESRNSSIEGNGLGLYLVKNIIKQHNGTVWAEYRDGMFYMNIRLKH